MKTAKFNTRHMATLALLGGILLIMSFTPLGYLNIGPLAITLNMIPVAVAAVALGPKAGAFMGAIFGLTSFLQCIGVGGISAMGVVLFEINPLLAFIQRFIPRILAGLLAGLTYNTCLRLGNSRVAGYLAGFCAALMNTVLFMSALMLLFGKTDYVQGLMGGKNVLLFMCTFVGINAVVEMVVCTVAVGLLSAVLNRTGFLRR